MYVRALDIARKFEMIQNGEIELPMLEPVNREGNMENKNGIIEKWIDKTLSFAKDEWDKLVNSIKEDDSNYRRIQYVLDEINSIRKSGDNFIFKYCNMEINLFMNWLSMGSGEEVLLTEKTNDMVNAIRKNYNKLEYDTYEIASELESLLECCGTPEQRMDVLKKRGIIDSDYQILVNKEDIILKLQDN